MMEAIIFTGIQASGKSTFYRDTFFKTHIRINLDMLKTRYREQVLLEACLAAKQRFVVDNTNPTADSRSRYIAPALAAGFRVISYWFDCSLEEALARNARRLGAERIPERGVKATFRKLEQPCRAEGFQELWRVACDELGFQVTPW